MNQQRTGRRVKPARKVVVRWGNARRGRWCALAVIGLACAVLAALPPVARAQLSDDVNTSTTGTQFIPPDPVPEAPPKPPPPPLDQEPRAAVKKPAPPPPPPRFPSVVFLVDTSDSMLTRSRDRKSTRLKEAKAALTQVLRGMSPETRVQVWTFNTSMRPVEVKGVSSGRFIPIGAKEHRKTLIAQVQALRTAGGTNLFQSVVKALAFFDARRDQALYRSGQRFPVLVVVSDGEDGGKTRETLKTVQEEKAKRPLVTVNAIGFSLDGDAQWFEELCLVATRREGCAKVGDAAQLRRILESFYRPPAPVSRP